MPIRNALFAIAMVATIGCSSDPQTQVPGGGGDVGHEGGGAGTGGGDPLPPICPCDLGSGCGATLAAAAADDDCTIPLLPDHLGDLLTCADGTWTVAESCADGCEATAPEVCVALLPSVAMEELVVQSQVEPFRGDQPSLPGDPSVVLVQGALADEGFDVAVDGWFGNETANVYADWQGQLGYSGLAANGIPGPSSLEELGIDRFIVEQKIIVGGQTSHSGKTINQRTKEMVVAAEAIFGKSITVTQGSYNAGGVSASAGTHDGGGAIDISVINFTTTQRWKLVEALRTVGFAAWLRTPSQGNWPYHIHAIAVGDTDVSISARNQIADYYVGLNGLASHAADNTPAAYQVPFTWWEKHQAE